MGKVTRFKDCHMDYVNNVVGTACNKDEEHCACVPGLLKNIDNLKQQLKDIKARARKEKIDSMLEKKWNYLFSPEDNYIGRWILAKAISKMINKGK